MIGRLVLSLVVLGAGLVVHADDWPEFRGPTGQGHSLERGLPIRWNENEHVRWKVPVPGRGWASPVVADGRVWLTTATETPAATSLRLLGYDADTGLELVDVEVFRRSPGPPLNFKNSRASPTPIVDGDRVYVHFGAEGTAAVTTSGEVVWRTTIEYESQHGNGGSPVLYRDRLVFSSDGSDAAFVIALDAETGSVRWRTPRPRPFAQAYTTPLVIGVNGREQIVSVGAYRTVAYDPDSGREIWSVDSPGFSNVPRPVSGHGLVYVTTGFYQATLMAVRTDGRGDVSDTHVAWTTRRGVPYTPSPVLVGDALYMVSDLGVLSCLDARTGETRWTSRLDGNYSASPVFADGRIYFSSEEGLTTVVLPGPSFNPIAENRVDGPTLASMAVSDGSFFIRSATHLYRVAER